jgi:putative tricarboxylic transport membrane protein
MSLNRLSGVVMLVFGLAMVFVVIPAQTETVDYGRMAPATFPSVVAGLLALFAAIHVALPTGTVDVSAGDAGRAALILALGAGALWLMGRWGYLLVAPALCALLMVMLRERRPLWLAISVVGVPGLIWLIVDKLLGRALP